MNIKRSVAGKISEDEGQAICPFCQLAIAVQLINGSWKAEVRCIHFICVSNDFSFLFKGDEMKELQETSERNYSSNFWSPAVKAKMDVQFQTVNDRPSWTSVAFDMDNISVSPIYECSGQPNDTPKVPLQNEVEQSLSGQINDTDELSDSSLDNPLPFILAGKAIFTVVNSETKNRFTFKVETCKDKENLHFASLLTGRNNEKDYEYLGCIWNEKSYVPGKKSRITVDATGQKVFIWFWDKLVSNKLPDKIQVFHEGRCGRCGRKLTVPESIKSGFGPECIKFKDKDADKKTDGSILPEKVIIESVNAHSFRITEVSEDGFSGETLKAGFKNEAKARAFALKQYPGAEIITMTRL